MEPHEYTKFVEGHFERDIMYIVKAYMEPLLNVIDGFDDTMIHHLRVLHDSIDVVKTMMEKFYAESEINQQFLT